MGSALLHRMGTAILTIWLAVSLSFFALRILPGNAIDAQLHGSALPQPTIDARKAALGLDKPLLFQYIDYLRGLVSGNWGQSLYTGQTVLEILANRLPSTLSLASYSILLAITLGIGLGLLSGLASPLQWLARAVINLSLGIPIYFTATVLLFLLATRIGSMQRSLVLPVFALGFHSSGAIARIIDTNLQNIKQAPFVQTALAKGLSEQHVVYRHILKIALLPAIPAMVLQAGILFSGTVITETIFGRAGLGLLLLDATLQRDYPVVQGVVVLAAIAYIVLNQLADILVQWLDPRLRQS